MQYAILHEGKDSKKSADNTLIRLLIKHLGFDDAHVNFYGMGSKANFFESNFGSNNEKYGELPHLLRTGAIQKALFIIDADQIENDGIYGGYDNTRNEILNTFNTLEISDYSSYCINCDPKTKTGYLESLILASIPLEQKSCLEAFLKCSDFKSKDNAKAILNQIYRQAYPNAPYDFSHKNFDALKAKLTKLFTED